MIVEDEETIIELYTQMLELFGHTVVSVAHNGKAALEALGGPAPLPDVVLLDHRMPLVTGLDVLQDLPDRAAAVPIIFATADEASRPEATRRGAFAVLVKPFSMDRLLDVVGRALEAHASGPEGGEPASA
jgi:two-component system chemotaxis response regulator CheY